MYLLSQILNHLQLDGLVDNVVSSQLKSELSKVRWLSGQCFICLVFSLCGRVSIVRGKEFTVKFLCFMKCWVLSRCEWEIRRENEKCVGTNLEEK